jgi:hypothetical protein
MMQLWLGDTKKVPSLSYLSSHRKSPSHVQNCVLVVQVVGVQDIVTSGVPNARLCGVCTDHGLQTVQCRVAINIAEFTMCSNRYSNRDRNTHLPRKRKGTGSICRCRPT